MSNGAAGKRPPRGRRTIGLNSRPNTAPGCSGEPQADGTAAHAASGRQALAAVAGSGAAGSASQPQVKAIKWVTIFPRCWALGANGKVASSRLSVLQQSAGSYCWCQLDP